MLPFAKVEALGNDFILVDHLDGGKPVSPAQARWLCDRHRGVGADGVLVVWPDGVAAARMQLLNADGSESAMCGNGLRCVAYYLHGSGRVPVDQSILDVRAGAQTYRCERVSAHRYRVHIGRPAWRHAELPEPTSEGTVALAADDRTFELTCCHLGNPHGVVFLEGGEGPTAVAQRYGALLEHHPSFSARANISFVRRVGARLEAVVHERGVGITQACGSGACAIVASAVVRGLVPAGRSIDVALPGGQLSVTVSEDGELTLEGDVAMPYHGEVELS
ncbi:MAG: diaminopimelate epimerase [Myxococcota bacterium]